MPGLCPCCYARDEHLSPEESYLSAFCDVEVRGVKDAESLLCQEHQKALASHVAAQVEILNRLVDIRRKFPK